MIPLPAGFYISRCGTEIKHIGYEPMPDPGRPDYQPFSTPKKIFSEPIRWIFVEPIDPSVTFFSPEKIWDDGSEEFKQAYEEFYAKVSK